MQEDGMDSADNMTEAGVNVELLAPSRGLILVCNPVKPKCFLENTMLAFSRSVRQRCITGVLLNKPPEAMRKLVFTNRVFHPQRVSRTFFSQLSSASGRLPVRAYENEKGGGVPGSIQAGDEVSVEWNKFLWDARIKQVESSRVLVTFENWDSMWDEWLEKSSSRIIHPRLSEETLRERRGLTAPGALKNPDASRQAAVSSPSEESPALQTQNEAQSASTREVEVGKTELPSGWLEYKDEDGTPYYHNSILNTTQWEKPSFAASEASAPQISSLPSGWSEFKDEEGTPYFHHAATNVTQWERPVEVALAGKTKAESLPSGWSEYKDPSGTPYYHHSSSGTTQWEKPTEVNAGEPLTQVEEKKLPEGWVEYTDSKGTPYYHNVVSNVTQWSFPSNTASREPEASLPAGWIEYKDDNGTPYYHCSLSNTTQWERPTEATEKPSLELPEGWTEYRDAASGVTKWERPAPSSSASTSVPAVSEKERSNVATGEAALPDGWVEYEDDQGTPYFHCASLGKTQWERPVHEKSEECSSSAASPAKDEKTKESGVAKVSADLIEGWTEHRTEDGTPYYHNPALGLTQWEKPVEEAQASTLPEGWERYVTEDGTPYFFNTVSNTTQWEEPSNPASEAVTSSNSLPEGWEEYTADNGDAYFFNTVDKSVQWERPAHPAASSVTASSKAPLPEGWTEYKADDGTPYFHHAALGVTQWDLPAETVKSSDVGGKKVKKAEAAKKETVSVLPSGWVEYAAEDGTPYFHNVETDLTQWERPTSPAVASTAASSIADSEESRLPDGWAKYETEDGTPYFHNLSTNTTQWETPSAASEKTSTCSDSDLPSGWAEYKTDDGVPYFHDTVLNLTQWERPTSPAGGKESEPLASSSEANQVEDKSLPEGWVEYFTEEGVPYYHCVTSDVTQWERPSTHSPLKDEGKVSSLPEGWKEYAAEDGTPYFHNSKSDVTQWERPSSTAQEVEKEKAASENSSHVAGWKSASLLTSDGQKIFVFVNSESGEASWTDPQKGEDVITPEGKRLRLYRASGRTEWV